MSVIMEEQKPVPAPRRPRRRMFLNPKRITWRRGLSTQLVIKRIVDLLGALALIVVLSPLLALIALAVKITSKGPVLYRQVRFGLNRGTFIMLKFRSMVAESEDRGWEPMLKNESNGVLFKMRADPRVTLVGRFLRRSSLDELPQLFNVLKGDMSLVGPRPPIARELAYYTVSMLERFEMKPGMTGLWQVSGRSDLSFLRGMALDVAYVRKWSLLMDLAIIVKTIPAVLSRKGAW